LEAIRIIVCLENEENNEDAWEIAELETRTLANLKLVAALSKGRNVEEIEMVKYRANNLSIRIKDDKTVEKLRDNDQIIVFLKKSAT
jgi:hypothetical protein